MARNQVLREQAYIILNSLKQFNKTPELIKDLVTLVNNSELSILQPLFELGLEYFDRNDEFPTGRYFLSSQYEKLFQPIQKPYTEDIYTDVVRSLRLQHVSMKSIKEIGEGNLENALATLSEFNNIRSNKKSRFDPHKYLEFYYASKNKGVGLLSGIPELDDLTKGYDYASLNVIAASPGNGKCLKYTSRIHTSKGYLNGYELEKYVDFSSTSGIKKESTFYDFKEEIKVRDENLTDKFYYNGLVDTIRIKSSRFEFEATPIHKVKVLDKELGVIWKELQDISVGDMVCCDNKVDILFNLETPKPSWLKHLSERDYGWFVGFFMGDGSICYNLKGIPNRISFTKREQIIEYIKDELVPNVSWIKYKDDRREDTFTIHYNSIPDVIELVELSICGKSGDKVLPDWVYSSNKEFLIGLLSGYLDSDGYGKNLELVSKSEELIKGFRDIFNLFGIYPCLDDKIIKYHGEDRLYYKLSFYNIDNEKLKLLDLRVEYKKEQLKELIEKDNWSKNNQKVLFTIPYKKELLHIYDNDIKLNIPYSERGKEIGIIEKSKTKDREYFTKNSWNNLKEILKEETLKGSLINYDLTNYEFVKVEHVTKHETETFDISVPENNTYTANGIVSHNTTLGVSLAYNAVMNENKNFIFFSLEVKDEHVYYSFLSRHSKEMGMPISASYMKKHNMNKQQELWYEKVGEDFNKRIDGKLFIVTQDDFVTFNTSSLEALIYECDSICKARGERLDGFVFDYLQLTKYFKPPTIKDEKEVMNYYTRYLLELSTSFDGRGLIGILLAQLNRTGGEQLTKNKEGSLFSFAEANELERSAHTALVLYASSDMRLSGNLNFYLVKNRLGETKTLPTNVVCDFPHYKVGNTGVVSIITESNEYMLDSELVEEEKDTIQKDLNSLESLLDL